MTTPKKETKAKSLPTTQKPLSEQLRKEDEDIVQGARNTDQLEGLRPREDLNETKGKIGASPSDAES